MRTSKYLTRPGLMLAAGVIATAAGVTGAAAWPSIGADTLGPQYIITIDSSGNASIGAGPGSAQGPYDGIEDVYVGVVNNFSGPVTALTLHGTDTSNGGSFAFDGDGIGAYTGVGTNATDTSSGKYGGPNAYFTNITCSGGLCNDGVVNFIGGIQGNEALDIFSLEGGIDVANFQVRVGSVPLPSTWAMMLAGFAGLGYLAFRGKKKSSTALAES